MSNTNKILNEVLDLISINDIRRKVKGELPSVELEAGNTALFGNGELLIYVDDEVLEFTADCYNGLDWVLTNHN